MGLAMAMRGCEELSSATAKWGGAENSIAKKSADVICKGKATQSEAATCVAMEWKREETHRDGTAKRKHFIKRSEQFERLTDFQLSVS